MQRQLGLSRRSVCRWLPELCRQWPGLAASLAGYDVVACSRSAQPLRLWKAGETASIALTAAASRDCLADGAFHLQLNQAVHFHRVLHGEFFDQWFDEAVDDHRAAFGLAQSAAHQVEQLLFTDT